MSEKEESSDRRGEMRRLICVRMDVAPEKASKRTVVIHDMSVTGAYVLATDTVEVGEKLALTIRFSTESGGPIEETTGEAVRVEQVPLERSVYWTHGIAIRFSEPLTHRKKEIDELAKLLEDMGVTF